MLLERQNVVEAFSVFRATWFTTGDAEAEHIDGEIVSEGYLPMLGVEPILGRNFPGESATPSTHYVALLGYDLWSGRFGRDPDVLGTEVRLSHPTIGAGADVLHFEDDAGRPPDLGRE